MGSVVTTPAAMIEVGHHAIEHGYNDVKLVEAAGKLYALCSSDWRGVDVIDVTAPGKLKVVSQLHGLDVFERYGVHTLAVESKDGKTHAYFGADEFTNTEPDPSAAHAARYQASRIGGGAQPARAAHVCSIRQVAASSSRFRKSVP